MSISTKAMLQGSPSYRDLLGPRDIEGSKGGSVSAAMKISYFRGSKSYLRGTSCDAYLYVQKGQNESHSNSFGQVTLIGTRTPPSKPTYF